MTHIEVWRELPPIRVAADIRAVVPAERLPGVLDDVVGLGGAVIAAVSGGELRGYATVVPSSALVRERWEHLPDAFELGSLEVAASARRRGLGTALLAALGATLPLERLLVFARGLAHHWDTERAGLPHMAYRAMLLAMLRRSGFERWTTDDPEVADHWMSFLAVRAGREVPAASLAALGTCAGGAPAR
jgi:GNAT superfamily N-acetyltransferase